MTEKMEKYAIHIDDIELEEMIRFSNVSHLKNLMSP